MLPTTWARIRSVTVNFIRSILRLTFVSSIDWPTSISLWSMYINISDNIHETILVFNIAYLMILASRSGTYFCFLYVVYKIFKRLILNISIYFRRSLSFYLYAPICYLIFLFRMVGSSSISSLAITLLTLPVFVVL